MSMKDTEGASPLDRWLQDAHRTLEKVSASDATVGDEDEEDTMIRGPARLHPTQRRSQREYLARQLTELARHSDPNHRAITAELLPADWTTFADFEFALRIWDTKRLV